MRHNLPHFHELYLNAKWHNIPLMTEKPNSIERKIKSDRLSIDCPPKSTLTKVTLQEQ